MILAWLLEEGARKLYEGIAGDVEGAEKIAPLFPELASEEEHHKNMLKRLYERRSSKETGRDFSTLIASEQPEEELTEGGIPLQEALRWVRGKRAEEILELVMSLEVNAYDRYLFMEREVKDEPSEEVFRVLARAEKGHMKRISEVYEQILRTQ